MLKIKNISILKMDSLDFGISVESLEKWDMIQDSFNHVFIVDSVDVITKTVTVSSQKGSLCVLDFRDFEQEDFYYKCNAKMMFKNLI